jgi:hypothetical protein
LEKLASEQDKASGLALVNTVVEGFTDIRHKFGTAFDQMLVGLGAAPDQRKVDQMFTAARGNLESGRQYHQSLSLTVSLALKGLFGAAYTAVEEKAPEGRPRAVVGSMVANMKEELEDIIDEFLEPEDGGQDQAEMTERLKKNYKPLLHKLLKTFRASGVELINKSLKTESNQAKMDRAPAAKSRPAGEGAAKKQRRGDSPRRQGAPAQQQQPQLTPDEMAALDEIKGCRAFYAQGHCARGARCFFSHEYVRGRNNLPPRRQ